MDLSERNAAAGGHKREYIYPVEMVVKKPEDFPFELIRGGRDYPFPRFPKKFYFYRVQGEVIRGITAELLYHAVRTLREAASH